MKYAPVVKPTTTPRTWELVEPFKAMGFTVPVGFIFDGASIPLGLWWMFPHGGRKFGPACFHDYCYRTHAVLKCVADTAFWHLMSENGVTPWKRDVMYQAVHILGQKAYNARGGTLAFTEHEKEKQKD